MAPQRLSACPHRQGCLKRFQAKMVGGKLFAKRYVFSVQWD